MKRRKRFSIRLVALGLAVVAIAAPTAQAVPTDPDTNRVESGLYAPVADSSRDVSKVDSTLAPQPAASDEGVATSRIVSAVLLLVAGAAAIVLVARSVRKGRLSPV